MKEENTHSIDTHGQGNYLIVVIHGNILTRTFNFIKLLVTGKGRFML